MIDYDDYFLHATPHFFIFSQTHCPPPPPAADFIFSLIFFDFEPFSFSLPYASRRLFRWMPLRRFSASRGWLSPLFRQILRQMPHYFSSAGWPVIFARVFIS
jgi:hypothetical protein